MAQFGTGISGLPVALAPAGARPGVVRGVSPAPFVSQLIAERQHLAPQRARRRAPVDDVLRTYDAAGRIGVRRLPPGYRLSVLA